MAPRRSIVDAEQAWPADIPMPLAFEVVRQHRLGVIRDPRPWFETIFASASPVEIIRAAERQLAGKELIDLSDWVMSDMPSHEARFIDDRSDVIQAALIGSLMTMGPSEQVPRFPIGGTFAALRDRIVAELDSLRRDEAGLREDFGIVDAHQKVERLQAALDAAYRERTAREVEAVVSGEIDADQAETLVRLALTEEWQRGFPRSLVAAGRLRLTEWRTGSSWLGTRTLELKEFFLADKIEPSTMEMMGRAWGRAFLDGEAKALFALLNRRSLKPRTWRLREIDQRLHRAVAILGDRGFRATHIVGPASWRLWEALAGSSDISHGPRFEGGSVGLVQGLKAFETIDDLSALVVMSLPSALEVEQQTFEGEVFRISVRAVDDEVIAELRNSGTDDVDGPGESPEDRLRSRVLVDIREAPIFRLNERAVLQVEIPEDLRDRW